MTSFKVARQWSNRSLDSQSHIQYLCLWSRVSDPNADGQFHQLNCLVKYESIRTWFLNAGQRNPALSCNLGQRQSRYEEPGRDGLSLLCGLWLCVGFYLGEFLQRNLLQPSPLSIKSCFVLLLSSPTKVVSAGSKSEHNCSLVKVQKIHFLPAAAHDCPNVTVSSEL